MSKHYLKMARIILTLAFIVIASICKAEGACQLMADMNAEAVTKHNMLRARHSTQPLNFDQGLATNAADYAKHLCDTRQFKHDSRLDVLDQGENLYYQYGSSPADICLVTFSWYNEILNFDWNKLTLNYNYYPTPPTIGHFTQVVWKETTKVGCAGAYRKEGSTYHTYIACRYKSPGNVLFRFPQNIGKTKSGLSQLYYTDMCSACFDSDPEFCNSIRQFDCSRGFFGVKDKCKKTCGAC